jgi:UDP-2,4-diacetamido-2,4,6-trideoxy-beta-L-altropyranose hydrolase
MVNLLIRADASVRIGTGHVMRCLALAHACRAQGGEVVFLSHCENQVLRQRIRDLDFKFLPLEESYPAPTDLQITLATLAQLRTDQWRAARVCLVLDGYHFDSVYQRAVQEAGRQLLVVDDTGHLPYYYADILLNHGLHAPHISYSSDVKTMPLLGSRYALLRPEFLSWRGWKREVPLVARRVLVTLGGSDPFNATLRVIQSLEQLTKPDLEVQIVVGPANPWLDELQQAVRNVAHRMQLLIDVTDMPQLMAWADVAISAGGGTCWELAFMGTPMATIVLADNQREVANALSEYGIGINLGDAIELEPARLAEDLQALLYDQARRTRMSTIGQVMVDGYGAERVVTLLAQGNNASINEAGRLRSATQEDAGLLWQWANDPLTRANSFHGEPIPWDQHVSWYRAKLRAAETRIWILECQGVPVGQIRYDRLTPDVAQISYVVAPGWRGRGVGTQLLVQSSPLACAELAVQRLQGVTFAANMASAQAFRRAGYQVVKEECIEDRPCLVFGWTQSELAENGR